MVPSPPFSILSILIHWLFITIAFGTTIVVIERCIHIYWLWLLAISILLYPKLQLINRDPITTSTKSGINSGFSTATFILGCPNFLVNFISTARVTPKMEPTAQMMENSLTSSDRPLNRTQAFGISISHAYIHPCQHLSQRQFFAFTVFVSIGPHSTNVLLQQFSRWELVMKASVPFYSISQSFLPGRSLSSSTTS